MNAGHLRREALQARANAAAAGDERVADLLEQARSGTMVLVRLDDLLGLRWQDTHHMRMLLTPPGVLRSVGAVAQGFLDSQLTWNDLASKNAPG
jgi:hypothetical protein